MGLCKGVNGIGETCERLEKLAQVTSPFLRHQFATLPGDSLLPSLREAAAARRAAP